ncbi:hypothetical protein DL769_011376 [Monosporascus sp. CRB-8-3]|nr:hypothetical protein DL769_011376 [Monosporascus sp. CRB-8-3]
MLILSMAPFGGADVAEYLAAACKIKDLDAANWNTDWHTQADKAESLADEASLHGDAVSARRVYIRAANYFRAAGYMLNGRQPGKSGPRAGAGVPVFVSGGGADSIQEELYFHQQPGAGVGWAWCWTSWRARARADLDFSLGRVALAGLSMSGYFALRVAADTRVGGCVAVEAFYDVWDFATHHTSPRLLGLWGDGWVRTGVMDGLLGLVGRLAPQLRWELGLTQRRFAVDSPAAALLQMKRYSLRGRRLEKVWRPVLVGSATQSLCLEPSVDSQRILDDLIYPPAGKKRLRVASEPENGGLQPKVGAFGLYAQRMNRFLDEHFGIERDALDGVNGLPNGIAEGWRISF